MSNNLSESSEIPPADNIVPLDFSSFQITVPESHQWIQSEGSCSSAVSSDEQITIPLIDLTDPNAAELIGKACEKWGMFQLVNHGVPKTLLVETESQTRQLFELPARQKMKALREPAAVDGYGMAVISKNYSKFMWHEGFTIMGSPVDKAKLLWPSGYEPFCEAMEEYQTQMKILSEKILRLMFKFLDISDRDLKNLIFSGDGQEPCNPLRLNSYPPCPEPDRVLGLAAHTDTSFFTIVHQSNTEGFQILKDGSGWVPVAPMTGSLVVNVGDLLHILSNARFPSIFHRVMIKGEEHRISVAYFFDPPYHLYISPFCKPLSTSPQSPVYRPVKAREYFTLKTKNKGNGLPHIKI